MSMSHQTNLLSSILGEVENIAVDKSHGVGSASASTPHLTIALHKL